MRIATLNDKKTVVDILYSAFVDIKIPNSINFIVKQDKKRNKRLKHLMMYLFNIALYFGEIVISDDNKACIILLFPHQKKTTFKTITWDIKLAIKTIGFKNILNVLKRERELKKNHLKTPHIHPIIMGVKKEYQGKGCGPRLINKAFNHYTNNKLPIIIETTDPSNLKLYKKFGFNIIKETKSLNYPLFFLKKEILDYPLASKSFK